MATRRPRIKPNANLASVKKRKKTVEDEIKPDIAPKEEHANEKSDSHENQVESALNENVGVNGTESEAITEPYQPVDDSEPNDVYTNESEATNASFKCPPKVDAALVADDASQPCPETDVIQMDLQKSLNGFPMSPSKSSRQRIRPTPIFGQRRNSFVGSSPSPHTEENSSDFVLPQQRRERHYSASQGPATPLSASAATHHYHAPHKFMPSIGGGRIRTESGCSAFSDTYTVSNANKRKVDENSQRIISRKDFAARFTEGIPEKSSLKMFDMIYYNPLSNPMESRANMVAMKNEALNAENENSKVETKSELTEKDTAMPVPQLKLDANGEPILDHASLVIETTSQQEARKMLANSTVIFQDENTGMNGFYTRQKRTREWPPEETVKFYRCLQTIGTDFSLMCQLFPNRTRRDLKLKFKKEERINGSLINKALLYPKIFNVDELTKQLDEEEREREETQRKWQELKSASSKTVKKGRARGKSSAARSLSKGDEIYRNEHVLTSKLANRSDNSVPKTECVAPIDIDSHDENAFSPIPAAAELSNDNDDQMAINKSIEDAFSALSDFEHECVPLVAMEKPPTLDKLNNTPSTHVLNSTTATSECTSSESASQAVTDYPPTQREIKTKPIVHVTNTEAISNYKTPEMLKKEKKLARKKRKKKYLRKRYFQYKAFRDKLQQSLKHIISGNSIKSESKLKHKSKTDDPITNDLKQKSHTLMVKEKSWHTGTLIKYENLDGDPVQPVQIINVQIKEDHDSQPVANGMHATVDNNMYCDGQLVDDAMLKELPDSIILPFDEYMGNDGVLTAEQMLNAKKTDLSANNTNLMDFNKSIMASTSTSGPLLNFDSDVVPNMFVVNVNSAPNVSDHLPVPKREVVESQSCVDTYAGRELNENDIERLLEDLSDGTLVLVSTLDEDNPDRMINEIYMVDQATGELVDSPLDIPEAIVQGIQSVMCADELN